VSPDPEQMTLPPDGKPESEQPAWRHDFPVDWPQDHYVARRDFTKFMVLTSFAFVVGQVWIGVKNVMRRRAGLLPVRRIAALDSVPVAEAVKFNYPDRDDACVLIRTGDRDWVAYSQKCTHLSCAVVPQPAKGCLLCPCHEGVFDLHTGRATSGPPRRPLPRVVLQVRGKDLYATGLEVGTS
jgi:Rieske Fe-S protein